MTDVLDQSEVDALLAAVDTGGVQQSDDHWPDRREQVADLDEVPPRPTPNASCSTNATRWSGVSRSMTTSSA